VNYFNLSAFKQSHLFTLVGDESQAVEMGISLPSEYFLANCHRILPDWQQQSSIWVVVVLQRSRFELVHDTPVISAEKQRLREKFMRFGLDLAFNLRDCGYLTDLMDPRTGYPLLSHPGEIPHDDTAAVKALLGYPILKNQCRVLIHPQWGTAVYPSILVSTAPPIMLEWAIRSIGNLHGWNDEKSLKLGGILTAES
jgi:hypothetical protein